MIFQFQKPQSQFRKGSCPYVVHEGDPLLVACDDNYVLAGFKPSRAYECVQTRSIRVYSSQYNCIALSPFMGSAYGEHAEGVRCSVFMAASASSSRPLLPSTQLVEEPRAGWGCWARHRAGIQALARGWVSAVGAPDVDRAHALRVEESQKLLELRLRPAPRVGRVADGLLPPGGVPILGHDSCRAVWHARAQPDAGADLTRRSVHTPVNLVLNVAVDMAPEAELRPVIVRTRIRYARNLRRILPLAERRK